MPLATSYTDATLAEFLHAELGGDGGTPAALGWSLLEGSYDNAVHAALRAYGGITTASGAADPAKLEALARVAVWKAVVQATAGEYDERFGDVDAKRSHLHKQALVALTMAVDDAAVYGTSLAQRVDVLTVWRPVAPYGPPLLAGPLGIQSEFGG